MSQKRNLVDEMRTKLKSVQEEAKSDCEIMVNSEPAPKGRERRGAGRGGDRAEGGWEGRGRGRRGAGRGWQGAGDRIRIKMCFIQSTYIIHKFML